MRLICWHALGEVGDIVVSIPRRQLIEPGVHRIILFNASRVDKAIHILIPRFQSLLPSLDGHVVAHLLCQRFKRLILRIFHAILSHARHQVLAHVVVSSQEDFRPHDLKRLLRHALQRFHLMLLAIVLHEGDFVGGRKDTLHELWVVMEQGILQRHPLGVREWYALFERLAGYLLQQQHLTVLIRQVEILTQHLTNDEEPIEMIGTRDGAARHQHVALP